MVKPVVNQTKGNKKKAKGVSLIEALKKDKKLQERALQNTANKWAKKYGFNGDLTLSRIAESGKSVYLAVDGKETKRKYVAVGNIQSPKFVSSMALINKG